VMAILCGAAKNSLRGTLVSVKWGESCTCYWAMSKTKAQTFRYRFGNETKTFWYLSRISLV